ncbi:MAG: hypothetical protein AAF740_05385 [Bacteroidota bacterium]
MTLKKFILLVFLLASYANASACDVCGCQLGGFAFGLMPQQKGHFFGLRYSRADFSASMRHNSIYFEDEFSEDSYQRVELVGRFTISPKFQMAVQLPYAFNEMDGSHQSIRLSGIGDPIVLAYYTLTSTDPMAFKAWKHTLLVGGGLKLPFGAYRAEDNTEIINRNFQLGSGSLDYLLSMNYTLRHKRFGFNLESAYKINTQNNLDYRFGNQVNGSATLFYQIWTPEVSVLPMLGLYGEQANQHTEDDIEQINTGGHAFFGTLGLQAFHKSWTLTAMYQKPIQQSFNAEAIATIEAEERFTVGLMYSFNFKKKKSKKG